MAAPDLWSGSTLVWQKCWWAGTLAELGCWLAGIVDELSLRLDRKVAEYPRWPDETVAERYRWLARTRAELQVWVAGPVAELSWNSEYHRATIIRATLQDGEVTKQQMLQYNNFTQGFTISVFLPILLPNKIVQRIKQHMIYNDKVTTLRIISVITYIY